MLLSFFSSVDIKNECINKIQQMRAHILVLFFFGGPPHTYHKVIIMIIIICGMIHLKIRFTSINHDIYLHNKVIIGQNTFHYLYINIK